MRAMPQPPPTLYQILGIQVSASLDEIRKAYKQKALETHPDKLDPHASEEEKLAAEANFHEVYKAFEVLSNVQTRREYDVKIRARPVYVPKATMSEKFAKRMLEREAWARKMEEEHQIRMAEIREQNRIEREKIIARMQEVKSHAEMVQNMVDELCRLNPEVVSRKKALEERKLRREQSLKAS